MWEGMTPNERAGVRFGLFPAVKMRDAERELSTAHDKRDLPRLLSVALMDCATRDGGMRA
jgi:hypothetical protein